MKSPKDLPSSLNDLQKMMKSCQLCLEAGYEIYPPAVFSGGK